MPVIIRGKRVARVDFSEDGRNQVALQGLVWDDIPGSLTREGTDESAGAMVIITGENGSGKTFLLNALDREIKSENMNHIYVHYNHYPNLSAQRGGSGQIIEAMTQFASTYLSYSGRKNPFVKFVREGNGVFASQQPIASILKDKLLEGFGVEGIRGLDDNQIIQQALVLVISLPPAVNEALSRSDSAMEIFHFQCDYYAKKIGFIRSVDYHELTHSSSYRDFLPSGVGPTSVSEFRDWVIERVLGESDPISRINRELREHLPYELYSDEEYGDSNFELQFKRRGTEREVFSGHFSSGEKMILTVLSWKYKTLDRPDRHPTDVLLLDECDKHFGPKLLEKYEATLRSVFVEHGTQVIMATHSSDMVALGDDSGLFVLRRREGLCSIQSCNKLLALSRLTRNLSAYYNQQTRIFTEGFDDANFYNAVYGVIKRIAFEVRQLTSASREGVDPQLFTEEQLHLRRLSFRYQMQFHAATSDKGASGDKHNMASLVMRTSNHVLDGTQARVSRMDERRRLPRFNANLFKQYRVDGTFGLIDGDYHKGVMPKLVTGMSPEIRSDRMVMLPRHSLENFHIDPIILSSLFRGGEEINHPFAESRSLDSAIMDEELRACMVDVRNALSELREGRPVSIGETLLEPMYLAIFRLCLVYRDTYLPRFKRSLKSHLLNSKFLKQRLGAFDAEERERRVDLALEAIPNDYLMQVSEKIQRNPKENNAIDAVTTLFESELVGPRQSQSLKERLKEIQLRLNLRDIQGAIQKMYPNSTPYATNRDLCEIYRQIQKEVDEGSIEYEPTTYHYMDSEGVPRAVSIPYPKQLKSLRGHDLEDSLIDGQIKKRFKDWILSRIEGMAEGDDIALFVPNELVGVFLDLNRRVKTQLVSKADPAKLQALSHDEAEAKGYYVPSRERPEARVAPVNRIFAAPRPPTPPPASPSPPALIASPPLEEVKNASGGSWCTIL